MKRRLSEEVKKSLAPTNSFALSSCDHLTEYYRTHAMDLGVVVQLITAARLKQDEPLKCHECESSRRLRACLDCVFVACGDHITEHLKTHGACLALSVDYTQLVCYTCDSYVYHAGALNTLEHNTCWDSPEELYHVKKHSKEIRDNQCTLGLRGMYNLGTIFFRICITDGDVKQQGRMWGKGNTYVWGATWTRFMANFSVVPRPLMRPFIFCFLCGPMPTTSRVTSNKMPMSSLSLCWMGSTLAAATLKSKIKLVPV